MKGIKNMILGLTMILLATWAAPFASRAYGNFGYMCESVQLLGPIVGLCFIAYGYYEKQ
ncbi:hypothetical protein lbkm_1187 [Lachnospiraceae bacterium KM106-2]|nr:hypothetical protein lbkm_1187 [Lachnospiraceae bacterium KM106-2]